MSRLTVYALVAGLLQVLALLILAIRFYVLEDWTAPMLGPDFAVFWSAARVSMEHGAALVFSQRLMQPLEVALWHKLQYAPWPYPPMFLLTVLPFGLLAFGRALILFSVLGLLSYGAMIACIVRRVERAWLPVFAAFPGISIAIALGQNSLLTVGAVGIALALIETNSALAGVCVAILAIKPQFGMLIPLALICGRQWKVLMVSALCTLAFVGISTAVLGTDVWGGFATFLPQFNRIAVEHGGSEMWVGMPTVFATSRAIGLPVSVAYVIHGLLAAPAVMVMAFLWAKRARFELRATAFVAATLLVQPYMMFYDLAWLILPIAFLMRDARAQALNRMEWAILAAAWMAPVQGLLAARVGLYLQIVPVILIALLVVVMRRYFASASFIQSRPFLGGVDQVVRASQPH